MQNWICFPRPGFIARLTIGIFLFITTVLGLSLAGVLTSSSVHADSGQANFALQPVVYDPSNPLTESYFIFDSKPATVINSRVRVTNAGTARGSVALYPVDATTGQTSGTVFFGRNDPLQDTGAWLTLGASQLTLNPGQSQVVSFRVTIPSSVRSGQHVGGIVAENLTQPGSSQTQKNSTFRITVKNLTIVAVQVNLPGTPVEKLMGTGVQAGGENGYQRLLVGLNNTGTVMLKPYGSLQVTDGQGQVVKNVSLKLDTFLPQTSINYPVAITGQALGAGDYQAALSLTYGNGQVLHYSTKFTVTSQQLTQVFGSTSSQTQAPPGFGGAGGMQLWQIALVAGAALALLCVAGNTLYKRLVVSRAKRTNNSSSQFKRPKY